MHNLDSRVNRSDARMSHCVRFPYWTLSGAIWLRIGWLLENG